MRSHAQATLRIEALEARLLLSGSGVADLSAVLAGAVDSYATKAAILPTDYDQYMLELINRARMDPAAEAILYGIALNEGVPAAETISTAAKQPLALNLELDDAARQHSQWMLDNDTFSHTGAGGSSPYDRMAATNYVFVAPWGVGENLAWLGRYPSVPEETEATELLHEMLFVDEDYPDRGHRVNMMDPDFQEVGIGVLSGLYNSAGVDYNSVIVTTDFAYSDSRVFLTGVAFRDEVVGDDFYTPGEGVGGLTVRAVRQSDLATFTTETWSTGGYSLELAAGTYDVFLTGAALNFATWDAGTATVGGENVKMDFRLDSILRPDLVLTLSDLPDGLHDPGSGISVTLNQENAGYAAVSSQANYRIELRLSADTVWGNDDDIILDPVVVHHAGLAVGQTDSGQYDFTIPIEAAAGSYYLAGRVDSTGVVSEENENNNTFWSATALLEVSNVRAFDAQNSIRFYDAADNLVTISLKGTGSGGVTQDDLGNIEQIWLNGTTDASQLIVKSAASTPAEEILIAGSLKSLKAKTLDLTGRLEITGGLGQLILGDIGDGAQIVGGAAPASGMKWKVNQVADGVDFLLAGSVLTFQAQSFTGGSLAADDLGKVTVKTGDASLDVRADLGDLDGLQVAGNLTGSINAAGDLGKILSKSGRFEGVARAGGDILKFQVNLLENAVLSAGGDVVKVAVKTDMIDSYILGGYDLGADAAFGTQQAGGNDALNTGNVYQVSVKGRFIRGYVAAGTLPAAPLTAGLPAVGQVLSGTIGKVTFGRVEYLSATETFGLYAASSVQSVKIGNESEAAGAFFEILDYSA